MTNCVSCMAKTNWVPLEEIGQLNERNLGRRTDLRGRDNVMAEIDVGEVKGEQ